MRSSSENPKFRLGLLLSPAYLARRVREPGLLRRAGGVFLYMYYRLEHAQYELRGRWLPELREAVRARAAASSETLVQAWRGFASRRRDRLFDARLAGAKIGFAAARRLGKPRAGQVANPVSPLERSPVCRYELSWNIHVACNYDCTYCWFHGHWDEFEKDNRYIPAAEWKRHWARFNAKYGPARVHIAGGEPFTYPEFIEILEELGKENIVIISTNLSWGVDRFIARVDPKRVELAASFHPEFVGSEAAFVEKILKLRRAGFHANVSLVAYPVFLPRIFEIVDLFLSRGIRLDVQPFRGTWEGRLYPQSYTAGSKRLIESLVRGEHHRDYYPDLGPDPKEHRVETSELVLEYQLGRKPTLGVPCNAGVFYGRLQSNGDVTRCAQGGYVGNFLKEDFSMGADAEPCPFKHCDCINEVVYIEGGPLGPDRAAKSAKASS